MPVIKLAYDFDLRLHIIQIDDVKTPLPTATRTQLASIHGVHSIVEHLAAHSIDVRVKPRCCREATTQAVEKALGVFRS